MLTFHRCKAPHCFLWAHQRYLASSPTNTIRTAIRASGETPAAAEGFWTLSQPAHYQLEVKGSKFLVTAWPIRSTNQALELVQSASDPSASHNCWAYSAGDAGSRSSDDGEPGGTAGRPILAAIGGEGLDNVCVLVTRHFGGTKLGTGGLVRAYGGAARDCLKAAPRVFQEAMVDLTVDASYDLLGTLYALLAAHGAVRQDERFLDNGGVRLALRVSSAEAAALQMAVGDASRGRLQLKPLEPNAGG